MRNGARARNSETARINLDPLYSDAQLGAILQRVTTCHGRRASSRRDRRHCLTFLNFVISKLSPIKRKRRRPARLLQEQAHWACRRFDGRLVLFSAFRALHPIPLDTREQGQPAVCLSQYAQHGRHKPKVEEKESQRTELKPMHDQPNIHLFVSVIGT
jgi:hypothetical protein